MTPLGWTVLWMKWLFSLNKQSNLSGPLELGIRLKSIIQRSSVFIWKWSLLNFVPALLPFPSSRVPLRRPCFSPCWTCSSSVCRSWSWRQRQSHRLPPPHFLLEQAFKKFRPLHKFGYYFRNFHTEILPVQWTSKYQTVRFLKSFSGQFLGLVFEC
jgi:hypothetical protein